MRSLAAADWLDLHDAGLHEAPLDRTCRILGEAWPTEDVNADTPGARNRRLLLLCQVLAGRRVACVASCPSCNTFLDLTLDTAALSSRCTDAAMPVELTHGGATVRLRLPAMRDLAAAIARAPHAPLQQLALDCLLDGDREVVLSPGFIEALSSAYEQADPLGRLAFALDCPECRASHEHVLDVAALFWSELEDMADQLVAQVHILAGAYGWSEADILALPARRRQRYIDMVSG
jgi:hypothetical protein